MDKELSCERCDQRFTLTERQPIIMPDCGHTFCEFCIADILTSKEKTCPTCGVKPTTTDLKRFCKNQQLLKLIQRYGQMKQAESA